MNNPYVPHAKPGELRDYTIGYLLSLLLTVVPFILVMNKVLSATMAIVVISALAVTQMAVHLTLFLRLHKASDEPFKLTIFYYTLIILAILVGASIWIMHHLDMYHMVP